MTALTPYSTGTVSVAANGTTVTGSGTIWSGVNVKPGDILQIGNFQTVITDVTDTAHLVIPPWGGGAQAGASYTIWQWFPQRVAGAQAMQQVSDLVGALNTTGFFFFVDVSLTTPDPSLGSDGQYAYQPTTGKMWAKVSGTWTYLGIYKGMNFRGAYDNTATYSVGDVQTTAGTSYVWINSTPGSGQSAPNPTYWQVLASIGATGLTGPQGAGYGGSSGSSVAIGIGSKAFAVGTNFAYSAGARARASSRANTSNWMEGLVVSLDSGTGVLTINVDKVSGSGTFADWNINLSGQPGAGDLSSANNLSDVANKPLSQANLGIVPTPTGRLTLTSGTPVMSSSVSGAVTIFYSPATPGNVVPVYNGSVMVPTPFVEVSTTTTDTTKNPSAIGPSRVNDWFFWNDAGTSRICHGPDWSSDTARSLALTQINGIWVNSSAITNGPSANMGTWIGTTRSNAASTLDFNFGAISAGVTPANFAVWNAYNRVEFSGYIGDSAGSWTYGVASTWRAANGSNNWRVSFVRGLAVDGQEVTYKAIGSAGASTSMANGIGFDSTSAFTGTTGFSNQAALALDLSAQCRNNPSAGYHYYQALELNSTTTASTWYGQNAQFQSGMHYRIWA